MAVVSLASMKRHKKRFGQHFLHDQLVLQQITAAINPTDEQQIIEIGPGAGALTKHLLERLKQLTVIELDRDLIPTLERLASNTQCTMTIINQDVLKVELNDLINTASPAVRVVGNLPYNISTPVIFKCLQSSQQITDMTFLLQKEVVNRLTSMPGSKSYGRLAVMAQYHCQTESLLDVAPESFDPPPRVESALVQLTPHSNKHVVTDYTCFENVVRTAFSQRRKTLSNSLKTLISNTEIESLGINSSLRPEQLSVEQFVHLSNHVSSAETAN